MKKNFFKIVLYSVGINAVLVLVYLLFYTFKVDIGKDPNLMPIFCEKSCKVRYNFEVRLSFIDSTHNTNCTSSSITFIST